jgi:hypothetical protein
MKNICNTTIIILGILISLNSESQSIISLGTTNYIYGNHGFISSIYGGQSTINSFGVGGYNPGFATGYYYYTLTRSGSFTTNNLQFAVDNSYWQSGSSHIMLIDNNSHYFSISGIIPYGTECSNIFQQKAPQMRGLFL